MSLFLTIMRSEAEHPTCIAPLTKRTRDQFDNKYESKNNKYYELY
jgi:hypothetical protein